MNRVQLTRVPLFDIAWALAETLIILATNGYSDDAIRETTLWLRRITETISDIEADTNEYMQ